MQPANGQVPQAHISAGFGPLMGDEIVNVEARGEDPEDYTVYISQVPALVLTGMDNNGTMIFQAQVAVPAGLFRFTASKVLVGPNGQPMIGDFLREAFFSGFPLVRMLTKKAALKPEIRAQVSFAERPVEKGESDVDVK